MPKRIEFILDNFWSKVQTSDNCWLWTAGKTSAGYGMFKVARRSIYAHRFAWMIEKGPIPSGMILLHSCDTPACCRIDHLRLGTQYDNMQDMRLKGRAPRTWKKLTPEQYREILTRYTGERGQQRALAQEYGVCPQLISRMVRNTHLADDRRAAAVSAAL